MFRGKAFGVGDLRTAALIISVFWIIGVAVLFVLIVTDTVKNTVLTGGTRKSEIIDYTDAVQTFI